MAKAIVPQEWRDFCGGVNLRSNKRRGRRRLVVEVVFSDALEENLIVLKILDNERGRKEFNRGIVLLAELRDIDNITIHRQNTEHMRSK